MSHTHPSFGAVAYNIIIHHCCFQENVSQNVYVFLNITSNFKQANEKDFFNILIRKIMTSNGVVQVLINT